MKICFVKSGGFVSTFIQWFTKSNWSHCLIILDDDLEGENLVFESSSSGGVKLSLYSKYQNKNKEVYSINRPCSIKPIYQYLGSNYGYLQILGYPVAKILGLKINPFKKDYVCSEIVLRFLIENGFAEFFHLDFNTASPEDIYCILSKSKNFHKET